MTLTSVIWQCSHSDNKLYLNDKSHKNAFCKGCVKHQTVSQIGYLAVWQQESSTLCKEMTSWSVSNITFSLLGWDWPKIVAFKMVTAIYFYWTGAVKILDAELARPVGIHSLSRMLHQWLVLPLQYKPFPPYFGLLNTIYCSCNIFYYIYREHVFLCTFLLYQIMHI